jgi:hypothetical protein
MGPWNEVTFAYQNQGCCHLNIPDWKRTKDAATSTYQSCLLNKRMWSTDWFNPNWKMLGCQQQQQQRQQQQQEQKHEGHRQ